MDWFLYDRDLHHERVNRSKFKSEKLNPLMPGGNKKVTHT